MYNSFSFLTKNIGATNIGLNYIIDIENYPKSTKEYAQTMTNELIKIHKEYKGSGVYEDRLARKIKAFTENNPNNKRLHWMWKSISFYTK